MDVSVCAGWRAQSVFLLVSFRFIFLRRPAGGGHSRWCHRFSASSGAVTVHDHFTSVRHSESHPVCQTQSGFVCVVLQLFMSFLTCQFGDHVSSELAAVNLYVLLWSWFGACWCRKFIQIQNENVWKPSKGEHVWSLSQANWGRPEILRVLVETLPVFV